jgi:hypothetical protein
MNRRTLGTLTAAAALVAACGGGLLAVLPFVAAIGGSWAGGTQVGNAFVLADPPQSLNFVEPTFPADLYIGDRAEMPAVLTGVQSNCGGPDDTPTLVARFDGPDFTLSRQNATAVCLTGTLTDDITLRLDTSGTGTVFRNQRPFDPIFQEGVWTNIARTDQRLRFNDDAAVDGNGVWRQTGCEYNGSNRTGTLVVTFRLGDAVRGTLMTIDSIVVTRSAGSETWSPGRMAGRSGFVVRGGGSDLSFDRRNETLNC